MSQMVSSLPTSTNTILPYYSSNIINVFGMVSLSSVITFPLRCFFNSLEVYLSPSVNPYGEPPSNIQTYMQFISLLPIGILLFYRLFQSVEIIYMKRNKKQSRQSITGDKFSTNRMTFKYYSIFIFIVSVYTPVIVKLALDSYHCINIDPNRSNINVLR